MAKYSEVVSIVLDLLKERSGDSFYTEEHVIFLASKMRALLLRRKLKGGRNSAYEAYSKSNMQSICLQLEPQTMLSDGCGGLWLKSTEKLPALIDENNPEVYAVSDMVSTNLTFVPKERMPYVGYNKWLKNIIYASRSADGYLYVNSRNPQFAYLQSIVLSASFEDIVSASNLSCDTDGSGSCDILELEFPLDSALLPSLIEMVVQELAGPRYSLDDMKNNDRDDLANNAMPTRIASPATREDREQQRVEQDQ